MPRKGDMTLRVVLKGEDDLSLPFGKAMERAERKAKRSFGRIERMGLRVKRGLTRVGVGFNRGMDLAQSGMRRGTRALGTLTKVTGATVGIAALAVDQFGKFELEVSRLGNVIGEGVDPVKEYERTLRNMAIQFGTDPIETAQAAYMAFSGGVKTTKKELMNFLPVALKAAKAGFAEPAVVVDALTSALGVFGKEGLTAAQVANKLFVAEALGKTDFQQIAASMGSIVGFAKAMGVSFEEVLAPMTSITRTGVKTDVAFTQLTSIMSGVVKPTNKAKRAFKKFKIPFGATAIKQAGGLVPLIQKIAAVAKKNPDAIVKMFGRKEAQKGLFRLTDSGLEDMNHALEKLNGTTDEANDKFANFSKRTGFKIQQMKTGFKLLVTDLGGGIAEGLGLDKLGDIPGSVESAGKKLRSGAKNFAEGFLVALSPGQDLSELNFDEMARSAGRGFGTMVTGLGKLISFAVTAIEKVSALASAFLDIDERSGKADAVDKKEAALGISTFTEDDTSLFQRGLMSVLSGNQRVTDREKSGIAKAEAAGGLKSELLGPAEFALLMLKRNASVLKKTGPKPASGATFPRKVGAAGAQAAQVGGEIKATIEVEVKGGTVKSAKVEATTKNPKVPVRAKVGKRKTASE